MVANVNFDKNVVGTPVLDSAGDTITYTFSIENQGPDAIYDLQLSDTILPGVGASFDLSTAVIAGTVALSGDTNGNGILEAGETWTFTEAGGSGVFTYAITQADLDSNGTAEPDPIGTPDIAGQIDNEALIVARNAAGNIIAAAREGAAVGIVYDPDIAIEKEFVNFTGGDGDQIGDTAGDILNYNVTVTNTGNITLTGVTVVDPLTGQDISGVTLAPGESQVFASSYVLTQDDLDNNGGGDGDIDNTATADSNETGPVDDSVEVPIVLTPALAIDKVVQDVGGDGAGGSANAAGDVITYDITVTNTGNVTLTNVTVVDPLTGTDINIGDLAVGASYTVEDQTYTVLQSDLEDNGGGDGDIDNTSTADSDQTGPVDDSEVVPLLLTPGLAIDKVVQDVGGDGAAGSVDAVGDVITYDVTVTNTGNVTLTNVTVVDPLTGTDINIGDLAVGGSYTVEDQTYTAVQADFDNNGGGDGDIDNTATADSDQTGPVDDSEVVPIILPPPGEEPGVRTPGFWQNPNNGATFWDGIVGNEAHSGPGFPPGELLYAVDSNDDGALDGAAGLLIGDYNKNGFTDNGEDTLFVSLANAKALVGAGGGSDGVTKVGRDLTATWLNFLSGNDIDNPGTGDDAANPQHFINDAVDWLQVYGDASASNVNNPLEDFEVYSLLHATVKSSSAAWKDDGFLDHSASEIHSALDEYNNTGGILGVNYAPSHDLI